MSQTFISRLFRALVKVKLNDLLTPAERLVLEAAYGIIQEQRGRKPGAGPEPYKDAIAKMTTAITLLGAEVIGGDVAKKRGG